MTRRIPYNNLKAQVVVLSQMLRRIAQGTWRPLIAGLLAFGLLAGSPPLAAQTSQETPEPRAPAITFVFPEFELARQANVIAEDKFNAPITDKQGRVLHVIHISPTALGLYSSTPPVFDGMFDWHKPEMRNLAASMSRQYGFVVVNLSSLTTLSIAAHLDELQVKNIGNDGRVTKLTHAKRARLSAPIWTDTPLSQGRIVSWGANAIVPRTTFPNPIVVYVIDAGVGYHQDLTTVSSRLAGAPAINPVGCYPHANHVAGIVAADGMLANSSLGGVVGAPVVSVSVGSQNHPTEACSRDFNQTSIGGAIEAVKADIISRGRVGIVNLSMNSPMFKSTGELGAQLEDLSRSTPTYPGAFVVQSAGNGNANACDVSYDVASTTDAIMVVGAIDANGQRVQPLNGYYGFRNLPHAQNEPGSNYGPCVQGYAPGNGVYSTWAPYPQPGNPPSHSQHAQLSGTSLAAPHVAAVAQYFATAYGYNKSEDIAWRVLLHGYPLGSKALPGSEPIWTYTTGGVFPTATPTVEFLIDGVVNGTVSKYTNQPFVLRYDSAGAVTCNVTAYMNGLLWYQLPSNPPAYNWSYILPTPGHYQWLVDCVSAQGTHGTAAATATVTVPPPTPTANWYLNGTVVTNQTATLAALDQFGNPTLFSLRYESAATTYCDLDAFKNPIGAFPQWWYNAFGIPTAYDWGGPISLPSYEYKWQIACHGAGGTATGYFRLILN